MATNPLIALSAKTPDIYGSFQRGRKEALAELVAQEQSTRQNRLLDLQERQFEAQQQGVGLERFAQRQKLGGQAVAALGLELEPLIQAGDVAGAQQLLDARFREFGQQGLSFPDPGPLRQALASGDTELIGGLPQRLVEYARTLGYVPQENAGSGLTSDLRTFRGMTEGLSPEEIEEARRINLGLAPRAVGAAAKSVNIGGVPHVFNPLTGGYEPAQVSGQQVTADDVGQSKANIEGQVTRAKKEAENEVKRWAAEPKARMALEQATARLDRVDALVESILPRISGWTAGFLGSKLASTPGTPAFDLARDIGTLQAIAGFDELNAMRASSPTGGALGNVTERELAFLQSVVRNIESSQSPEQLRRNLEEFQREVRGSWERVARAYQQDYGQPVTEAGQQIGGPEASPQPGEVLDGYRFRGGDPGDPNSWEPLQ